MNLLIRDAPSRFGLTYALTPQGPDLGAGLLATSGRTPCHLVVASRLPPHTRASRSGAPGPAWSPRSRRGHARLAGAREARHAPSRFLSSPYAQAREAAWDGPPSPWVARPRFSPCQGRRDLAHHS